MRIAVSGTHASGKSTLIGELAAHLPEFSIIDEPYHTLQADGHVFGHEPVPEDFELQLQRSLELADSGGAVLFDRCPLDFLAYLACLSPRDPTAIAPWLQAVEFALQRLDLVVFVPLESPDRIDPGHDEFPRLRRRVDTTLRRFLLEDSLGISPTVIQVSGPLDDRVAQVLSCIRESR